MTKIYKYKIGDRVRVTERAYEGAWGRIGIIGKKARWERELGNILRVEYLDGGFDHFPPSELSPLKVTKVEKKREIDAFNSTQEEGKK